MAKKWFKSDWSLAYFLYYMCWIGYWMIILTVVSQTVTISTVIRNSTGYVYDVPVNMNLKQFSDFRDIKLEGVAINIPEKVAARIGIEAPFGAHISAFAFYYGLKLYEAAILFIILFVLAKVLKNVALGDPFNPKNPFYLYVIGWTLFISSVINLGIRFLPLPILSSLALPDGFEITSLNMFGSGFMMLGIFVIVLGYVFKEGVRLYEEQKLTV